MGAAEPGAGAPDLMTQHTETAALIVSAYYFRCPIAQHFHALLLTSVHVPIFGVVMLNIGQVSLLLLISVICSGEQAS